MTTMTTMTTMTNHYPHLNLIWEHLKNDPEMLKFRPRRIVCPPGYTDPKFFSLCTMTAIKHRDLSPPIEYEIDRRLVLADMPMYFLDAQFMQAVLQTQPKEPKPTLKQLHFPLSEMILCLPEQVSRSHFHGFHVPFVSYAISDSFTSPHGDLDVKDVKDVKVPKVVFEKQLSEGKFTCPCCGEKMKYEKNGILLFHSILIPDNERPLGYYGKVPVNAVPESIAGYNFTDNCENVNEWLGAYIDGATDILLPKQGVMPTSDQDRSLPDKVFELIYKLLLVLNAGKTTTDRFSEGALLRKPKQIGDRVRDALWSANFIGAGYRPKGASLGGTHSSPRLHWRRGHTRMQACGPQHSLRSQIWIEPTLVGDDQ